MMSRRNENQKLAEFFEGLSLVLGWNLLISLFGITAPFIGAIQMLYVMPWIVSLYRQEKWEQMKGVVVGAIVTFLLNSACWLWILNSVPS